MIRLLLIVFLMPMLCSAAQPTLPVSHPVNFETIKAFQPVRETLEALVAQNGKVENNHLCVIGADTEQAWVYWREANAIILWEPETGGITDLTLSRDYLNLTTDAVPANDPRLPTSTYLVSTQWAAALISECSKSGRQYEIDKKIAVQNFKPSELAGP
jgi:hypothetical protein